jgi:hypothetical protein
VEAEDLYKDGEGDVGGHQPLLQITDSLSRCNQSSIRSGFPVRVSLCNITAVLGVTSPGDPL